MDKKVRMSAENRKQRLNRIKYNKANMGHLCTIRVRKKNLEGMRRAKARLRGLSWLDIIYRGLGLKRGS